jgi:hypothetical protein
VVSDEIERALADQVALAHLQEKLQIKLPSGFLTAEDASPVPARLKLTSQLAASH